jgi:hypothetical protein
LCCRAFLVLIVRCAVVPFWFWLFVVLSCLFGFDCSGDRGRNCGMWSGLYQVMFVWTDLWVVDWQMLSLKLNGFVCYCLTEMCVTVTEMCVTVTEMCVTVWQKSVLLSDRNVCYCLTNDGNVERSCRIFVCFLCLERAILCLERDVSRCDSRTIACWNVKEVLSGTNLAGLFLN